MTCDSVFALGKLFSGWEEHQEGAVTSLISSRNEDGHLFSVSTNSGEKRMISSGNSLTKCTFEKNKVNGCLVTEGDTTSEDRSIREPQIRNAELAGKTHQNTLISTSTHVLCFLGAVMMPVLLASSKTSVAELELVAHPCL